MPDGQSPSSGNPDELFTVDEVAAFLGLNSQTVRNMIERRDLGAVWVGQRRVRVRRSQIDELPAAGERPAKAVLREVEGDTGALADAQVRTGRGHLGGECGGP